MSLDPQGHIKISVSNFAESKQFYSGLFSRIGYRQIIDEKDSAAWVSDEGFGIWIAPAEKGEYKFKAPGLHHFCFKAQTKAQVDELYTEYLLKNKIHVFDKPAQYSKYTPDYYEVFFADPDGIKLEFACY